MFRRGRILSEIDRRTEKIETILLLRDPGATMAAEAYGGLRQKVLGAETARTAHLAHLAMLDAEASRGTSQENLEKLLRDLLAQVGLERVDDPARAPDIFDIEGEGATLELVEPAYIDTAGRQLVRHGRARATRGPEDGAAASLDGAPRDALDPAQGDEVLP